MTELDRAEAHLADLASRLQEAAAEALAQRDRAEAAARELDETRTELDAVRRELDLVRGSRSYRVLERVRGLLGR